MTKGRHTDGLDAAIAAFIAHRRVLGRRYYGEEGVLRDLHRFMVAWDGTDLTAEAFEEWCRVQHGLSPNTLYNRQLLVRKLCLFRRRSEPSCFVPDPACFAHRRPYRRAVIVTPAQVGRMLRAASNLSETYSPMRSAVMRMALVLLYCAGLRRGEVTRLTLADIDHRTGIVHIRESKFHKSRWVPLSTGARRELRGYLRIRRQHRVGFDLPLLCNCRPGYGHLGWHGFTGESVAAGIRELFTRADVHDAEGRRPRVHDLRHSFAVEALSRQYRTGRDVQSFLPRLSLYMGHVSIVSTARYLQFVPDIACAASERFRRGFTHVIAAERT
jgi:integrase/recombinase XerD